MKIEDFFYRHPVFTGKKFADYLSSRGEVGPRTKEAALAYHRKTGRIVLVRRGLYAVVPPGADPDSYQFDPFLLVARLTKDATLAYHTALELHGRAYSVHNFFTYAAVRPLSPITFRSLVFRGVRFPQALCRKGKEYYGSLTVDRRGLEVHVTGLERTLVDVLDRPDLSGSWEEIWRSLESVEFLDLDKVVEYTILLGNATTVAKVGFFLEQRREILMVDNEHLRQLQAFRPLQPHYLDRHKRKSGRLVSGWNLVVPKEVLERSWAGVL